MRKSLSFLSLLLLSLQISFAQVQVFSNTTVAACDAWNSSNNWSTALSRTITTSGLPTTGLSATGTVLREVRVRLGNSTCRGNLSTYRLRITNPQGVQVEIANGLTSTTNSVWADIKFRDDIALERLKEYLTTTQTAYYPYSIGYYALETDGSFANFNTSADPNGNWLFEVIENTTSEVSFEKVELVFGPPIAIRDVTSCTTNNFCSGASCIYNGVFRGNNFGPGYPALDPQYPGNAVNGCAWNGNNNNSAWFSFKPTTTSARITISGMLNSTSPTSGDMQPIILKANGNCGIPNIVPTGGCPKDQTINNRSYSNDVAINPSPNTGGISTANIYINGISSNCEFNLSGLTVGDTYYLYVDGNGGSSSFFYVEVENGVSTPCDFCCTPITLTGPSSVCSGASPVNFSISGGTGSGTWTVTPASAGTISSTGVFTPASGITSDILAQVNYTEGDCSRTSDIIVTKCTTFGIFATAPYLTTCQSNSFFNTTGSGADLIDQTERKDFNDTILGTFVQNSGRLKLRGAEVKTFKNLSLANVCGATFFYRVVPASGTPGAFTSLTLPFFNDCNTSISQFPSGGPCVAGQQKWQTVRSDAQNPVDLTAFAPGNYTLQVYYEVTGDENSTTACDDKLTLDNAGRYYNATFTIQATPTLSSTNPTTCNGTEGTITIGGLAPSTVYSLTYTDDGTTVGPADQTSDASGNIVLTGLNPGAYASFSLTVNGCTTPLTGSITLVNPVFNPTFSFGNTLSFCGSATVPTLPTTSDNGITGTWNPTVINNSSNGTYTFTPTAGQCATTFVLNVSVTGLTLQTNKTDNTVCNATGGPGVCVSKGVDVVINEVRHYPVGGASTQGIIPASGRIAREYIELYNPTCNPLDISCYFIGSASKTTSTPSANSDFGIILPKGTIIAPKSHYVIGSSTLNSNPTVVDFKTDLNPSNYCSTTPNNMVLGNTDGWVALYKPDGTPVDAIYWTVSANQASKITSDDDFNDNPCTPSSVTGCNTSGIVLRSATEIYNFNQTLITYVGITAANPVAPSGKTFSRIPDGGAWQSEVDSSIVNNCNNGQCDTPTPTGTCNGSATVTVIGASSNVTYQWKDAQGNIVANAATASALCPGTYCVVVTDNTSGCKDSTCVTIIDATPQVTPQFDEIAPICAGASAPTLPTTSKNNITGTWSPATIDNQNTGNYTFTPNAGQCANPTSITVTVNPKVKPTFDPVAGFCQGAFLTQQILPTTSNNGITGTWNPAALSSAVAGNIVYTFTPTAGLCADTTTITVVVTPNTKPTFTFGRVLTICALGNTSVPTLTSTSIEGVTGTWSPSVVNNTTSGIYIFTPDAGQCADTTSFNVTVNQPVTPTFTYGTSLTICSGGNVPTLAALSTNNILGIWDPINVSNTQSGVYTFTPAPGSCATSATFTVTVNPTPSLNPLTNIVVNDGDVVNAINFTGNPQGTVFNWTNSVPGIGLAASGVGNIPSFTAVNLTNADIIATITVTPTLNTCTGAVRTFTITVKPRTKDVFVPNVFSPNGDGKNDLLKVYGNYITSLEMRIFSQWGEQMIEIRNINQGWDGTHKGKPQPVGVYVYVLKATLSTGKTVTLKGSITLVR